jgi:23S rRNA (cytosine1962-C5)-methyltransferase
MPTLTLKPGRERSLERRHPWIFSGAVARLEGACDPGDTVEVCSSDGGLLARAALSPRSQIRARVWTFGDQTVDAALLHGRIAWAVAARRELGQGQLGADDRLAACRLVYAESDGLPGLIADRYADTLVVQLSSAGAERWRETLVDALLELTGCPRVWERSDVELRKLEGLAPRTGPLRGDPPPDRIEISEGELRFWVDVRSGHKTGAYLDQRLNRIRVGGLAAGRRVLDCFCSGGGFAVHALAGGARSAVAVDSSTVALAAARDNLELNGIASRPVELIEGNAFELLRAFRDSGRSFDLIVLDPPKFAASASHVARAARGYKDINLLAFKLLEPGGLLVTFSCSAAVSSDLFDKIVAGAALDAGVEAQIVERLGQPPDHPVALAFPEGRYLKGLICLRR